MSANGRAKVSALPLNLNSDLPVRLSAACPLTGGMVTSLSAQAVRRQSDGLLCKGLRATT